MANTNVVPQGLFGPGILWMTRTDLTFQTPINVGFVNEFQYDFAFDTKQLFGQNQFALLAARGTAKCNGKIKAAVQSGQALNTLLLGGAWTNGTQYDATTTAATNVTTSLTPTVPSTGTWNADLGVIDAATGNPFTLVASAPAASQYSVAAGVYTFNAADTSRQVKISFAYTYTSGATGMNQTIANQLIGVTPTFQIDYKTTLYGATFYLRLFNAIGTKWAMNHKITDFAMPEYDFEFFSNAGGNIGVISLASQA